MQKNIGQNKCEFIYTSLLDSVIFAENGFKGHQYDLKDDSGVSLRDNIANGTTKLIQNIKNGDFGLVMTLNQICDNRFIWFSQNINDIFDLIKQGKVKVSTYGNNNILTYTKNALEECLKRLCGDATEPDNVYISSMFPLMEQNTNKPSRKGIERLLGRSKDLYYDGRFYVIKKGAKSYIDLNDFIENKNLTCGIYTAFCKYERERTIKENDCIIPGISETLSSDLIKNWIENLFKMHEELEKSHAYESNKRKGFKLNDVLDYLLDERNIIIIEEKMDILLGRANIDQRDAVKTGIFKILRKSSQYEKRTAMYLEIRNLMEEYAESRCKEDETLYNKFHTKNVDVSGRLPYQRIYYVILALIDYAYNILNMLYSSESLKLYDFDYTIVGQGNQFFLKNISTYNNIKEYTGILNYTSK